LYYYPQPVRFEYDGVYPMKTCIFMLRKWPSSYDCVRCCVVQCPHFSRLSRLQWVFEGPQSCGLRQSKDHSCALSLNELPLYTLTTSADNAILCLQNLFGVIIYRRLAILKSKNISVYMYFANRHTFDKMPKMQFET